jgi:hypothetical protein
VEVGVRLRSEACDGVCDCGGIDGGGCAGVPVAGRRDGDGCLAWGVGRGRGLTASLALEVVEAVEAGDVEKVADGGSDRGGP